MQRQRPVDIFNDVLGPVMTGPSSSHTAGPARIGHLVHDLGGGVRSAVIQYSNDGAYAGTLTGQASDRGFAAGLLGMGCDDPLLPQSLQLARSDTIEIIFQGVDGSFTHPNTAILHVIGNDGKQWEVESISTGGGNIRILRINGTAVDHDGSRDLYVSLDTPLRISETPLDGEYRCLRRILPVEQRGGSTVLYATASELLNKANAPTSLSEAAVQFQAALSGWTPEAIIAYGSGLLDVMAHAAQAGLQIDSSDAFQWVRPSAKTMASHRKAFIPSGILNESILISTAIMEHDRNMGVIVAAPTAGSAGVIPSLLLPHTQTGEFSQEQVAKALLAAGLVGVFILNQATFAAEVAGCQAENGTAAAMAAAALCDLYGADLQTSLKAASLALSNMLGIVCDPVGGGVEIPCISRNASAAANALISANMVMGGFDPLIPLDEVIQAMLAIGNKMHPDFRCTARGGLAATPTARYLAGRDRG